MFGNDVQFVENVSLVLGSNVKKRIRTLEGFRIIVSRDTINSEM